MRITSLVEFAARIMVRLASLPTGATLSAEKLSDVENISRDVAYQVLQRLRKAELVASTRGAQGGYALAKPASRISIGATIRAMEGTIFEEVCEKYSSGSEQCARMGACGLRPVWTRLGEMIEGYLDHVTLDQLVSDAPARGEAMSVKDFGGFHGQR